MANEEEDKLETQLNLQVVNDMLICCAITILLCFHLKLFITNPFLACYQVTSCEVEACMLYEQNDEATKVCVCVCVNSNPNYFIERVGARVSPSYCWL